MMKRIALAALLMAATTGIAQASPSSIPFTALGAALNGADLANSTAITSSFSLTTSAGTGIYAGIPQATSFSGPTLTFNDLAAFTFSGDGYTFTSNADSSTDEIVTQTPSFLDVYLRGNFNGVDTSITLTASSIGGSVQEGWVLYTPPLAPPQVPEPSTLLMGLMGAGIIGGTTFVSRRRANKVSV